MEILQKIKNKIKYGTVMYSVVGKLSYIGLEVQPYYLEHESLVDDNDLNVKLEPKLDSYSAGFFDEKDLKKIAEHPENPENPENPVIDGYYKMDERIADGCLCFGVKHKGEIASYTWCDLKRCNYEQLQFSLKDHEAYLFDAYAFKDYRGKNLAPYMRYQLYKQLTEIGRTFYYSISYAFNTPSIKFKRKLKAKPLKLYLYISFLEKYNCNIILKNY